MKAGFKKVLLVLGVLGLLASVVAGRERPSAPALVEPAARLEARIDFDLSKLESRIDEEGAKSDPFAQKSWEQPEAAAPQREQRPPKPTAPPLPFAYLGKVIEEGKLSVFLAHGGENLTAKPGDTIAGEYRLDAVTENEIRFTYLPLKTQQSLPL